MWEDVEVISVVRDIGRLDVLRLEYAVDEVRRKGDEKRADQAYDLTRGRTHHDLGPSSNFL